MDNPVPEKDSNTPSVNTTDTPEPQARNAGGPRVSVDQLLLAGSHFGHLTQRWNPKMKPYIFMARNGIYLIDLQKTSKLIEEACNAATKIAARGEDILFVGTKKQARDIIEAEAKRATCPYVTYRWLGGMLTNFSTIRKSIKTLDGYEKMSVDGTYEKITKKEQLTIEKAKEKLTRTLGGIHEMRRLPGGIFIVDTRREDIGVAEARKLGIPVFAIVDTNADPDLVDYPIPANDDAFKSIGLICRTFADAIIEGKSRYKDTHKDDREEKPRPPANKTRARRSRRRRPNTRRPEGRSADNGGGKSVSKEEDKS